jgi:hypothetical protein
MEIWHRHGYNHLDNVESELDAIGVKYKKTPGFQGAYAITFEITESDPRWPQANELMRRKSAADFVWTEYTPEETLKAEWLKVGAIKHIGLAQPEANSGWREVSFDGGCRQCGVGARQKAPFRIKSEPRLKTLFATVGNGWPLFAVSQIVGAFKDAGVRGYETWSVLLHKSGRPSACLQQMYIPTIAQPALVEEAAESERFWKETCRVCGQLRYTFYTRGMMPLRRSQLASDVDLQLTDEWFGTARASRREILVSNRVARVIMALPATGIVLWPVRLL